MTDDDPIEALVADVKALSRDEAFRLYLKLAEEDRDKAQVAALGIREKARAGQLDEQSIPLLEQCLLAAPDERCVVHFAKALAAFGRKAQSAAKTLVTRTRDMRITDDALYWIVDGCLWSLGYLGGQDVQVLLRELESEAPSRAVRFDSIYKGAMSRDDRGQRFAKTLEEVAKLAAEKDPGVWRERKTNLKPIKSKGGGGSARKPWTVR